MAHSNTKHDQQADGHSHGMGRYIAVWLILLAFTVITVVTGRMHMPTIGIYLAMAIACTKAALVVLFFMHLWDGGAVNKLIFVASVLFVGVLVIGVFGDIWRRYPPALPGMGPAAPVQVTPPSEQGPGH